MPSTTHKVALLWAGDPATRHTIKLEETRLSGIADALRQVGIAAEPAVYADEVVDEVRDQLLRVDGVLVWVDPIVRGRDRSILDALLRHDRRRRAGRVEEPGARHSRGQGGRTPDHLMDDCLIAKRRSATPT